MWIGITVISVLSAIIAWNIAEVAKENKELQAYIEWKIRKEEGRNVE